MLQDYNKTDGNIFYGMATGYASTSNAVNPENTILLLSLHFGEFERLSTKRNDTGASYAVTTQQTGKQLHTINRHKESPTNLLESHGAFGLAYRAGKCVNVWGICGIKPG